MIEASRPTTVVTGRRRKGETPMRGEAERGRSTRGHTSARRWVWLLTPVPSIRRSRAKPTPNVHRAGSSAAPMPRSGRRGLPDSFGYEPFMCAWEHPHTNPGHRGGTTGARTGRRQA
jgi:hypothetical protein